MFDNRGYSDAMSARTTSGMGTLAQRLQSSHPRGGDSAPPEPSRARHTPARHVLALTEKGEWVAALLVKWVHKADWWGEVILIEHGEPALLDMAASRLRPAPCECCSSTRP